MDLRIVTHSLSIHILLHLNDLIISFLIFYFTNGFGANILNTSATCSFGIASLARILGLWSLAHPFIIDDICIFLAWVFLQPVTDMIADIIIIITKSCVVFIKTLLRGNILSTIMFVF